MSVQAPGALRGGGLPRVLIVRTGAMGDVLHAMPGVAAMRQRHPEWHIGWAIEPRWIPLLRAVADSEPGSGTWMPLVNRVHEVPTRAWNQRPFSVGTLASVMRVRRELREARYDICVDMQGLLRSAVVGRFARAKTFAGFARPREAVARWLYTERIATSAVHVIDRGCELLGKVLGEELRAARVPLPVDREAERWCDALVASLPPRAGGRFAVFAPTAGWGAKQWPSGCYGSVAAALSTSGFTPLINAARLDDQVAASVAEASGGVALPVVCDMTQLVALLRRASVVIAGDTGPLHLAAALGRPVVALFGPTDPRRTGPYGTRAEVIRHESSSVDHRRHSIPEEGLAQITVEEVVAAAARLLGGAGEGGV